MTVFNRSVIIWIHIGISFISIDVYAQQAIFSGGRGDGHSKSQYKQSQPTNNQIFMGGHGDGHNMDSYHPEIVSVTQLFVGGIGDGFAVNEYLQSTPLGMDIYFGGHGDGADMNSYEQGVIIPFGIYTGGDGDGYAKSGYTQDMIPGYDLFRGGIADGHAQMNYVQSSSTGFALYIGGPGDGHAFGDYLQETNPDQTLFNGGLGDGYSLNGFSQTSPAGTNLYAGGAGDGADQDDYEQGVIAVFGVYTGGEGDGFDVAAFEQTDFVDALPVELVSFTARLEENQVELSWTTVSEVNNDYFLVERSNDLKRWSPIDSIKGAGNSNALIVYESVDSSPVKNVNYYRLLQVDYDGTRSYSMIRSVKVEGKISVTELIVYPNPVRDRINLQFSGFASSDVTLKIFDAQGKQVYVKELKLEEGQGVYEINRATNMLEGFYVVILSDELNGNVMKTRMLVK